MPMHWFANEVRNYIDFWKSARPIAPDGEVLIPGEIEQRTLAERSAYRIAATREDLD